jgi:hypothetical protein
MGGSSSKPTSDFERQQNIARMLKNYDETTKISYLNKMVLPGDFEALETAKFNYNTGRLEQR